MKLRSCHCMQALLNELSKLSIRDAQLIDYKCDAIHRRSIRASIFVPRPIARPLGLGLSRPTSVRLKRLRNVVKRLQSSMQKWELMPTSICECGALDQTAAQVILKCPLHCVPRGYHGLLVLDDETRSDSTSSSPTSEEDEETPTTTCFRTSCVVQFITSERNKHFSRTN